MTAASAIASAPRTTFATLPRLAPLSSQNSTRPQRRPMSEFAFQKGKETERPTSRTAKTVSVLPSAQRTPARRAQMMRCFLSARSAKTYAVPFSKVGNVQRDRNTPHTIADDRANGEKPAVTSLVGASAAPSQTAAVKPQMTPRPCRESRRFVCLSAMVANVRAPLMQQHEKRGTGNRNEKRHKKVTVRKNRNCCLPCFHPAPEDTDCGLGAVPIQRFRFAAAFFAGLALPAAAASIADEARTTSL